MNAIIISQVKINETDLLLTALLDDDETIKIKIPGILKSKKRSTNSFYPGSVLSFVIANPTKNILIPKEHELLYSPVGDTTAYDSLVNLEALLAPLKLSYVQNSLEIYSLLFSLVKDWASFEPVNQHYMIDRFYQIIMKQLGIFHEETICCKCDKLLNNNGLFYFHHGIMCNSCRSANRLSASHGIPQQWFQLTFENYADIDLRYSISIRKTILQYIKSP